MMFAYLLIVVVVVTIVLQQWLFPAEAFRHILATNKNLDPEMRLQLKMSMRTEIIARFYDCVTGLSFIYSVSQEEDNASVVEWSAPGKFCLASFLLKSIHYIPFM
jgi:hypothetical protein